MYTGWGSSDSYIDCIVVRASISVQLVHPAHSISVHIIMCYHVQPMLPMWGAHNSLHNCSVFRNLQRGRMGSGISLKFFLALWEVEYGGPSLNLFLVQWKTFVRGQLTSPMVTLQFPCLYLCVSALITCAIITSRTLLPCDLTLVDLAIKMADLCSYYE